MLGRGAAGGGAAGVSGGGGVDSQENHPQVLSWEAAPSPRPVLGLFLGPCPKAWSPEPYS